MKKTKKHFDLMIVICSLSELAIGLAVIFFGNRLIRNNEYFSSLNYASAKNDGVYSMYILSFMHTSAYKCGMLYQAYPL